MCLMPTSKHNNNNPVSGGPKWSSIWVQGGTGDVGGATHVETGQLGATADDHLDAGVAQTDAVGQVQVLQLQEEHLARSAAVRTRCRTRRVARLAAVALRAAAAAAVVARTRLDARDLRTACTKNDPNIKNPIHNNPINTTIINTKGNSFPSSPNLPKPMKIHKTYLQRIQTYPNPTVTD